MALTAALKRSYLEAALATAQLSQPAASLRATLVSSETSARSLIAAGSIKANEANRQRNEFFDYGPGQITAAEAVELYRYLIDLFGRSQKFLNYCALYGLDAFDAESNGTPNPLPPPLQNPVTIADQKWNDLQTEFVSYVANIGLIVGAPVADLTVFLWMMYHLYPITEFQADHIWLRIPPGLQYV